MAKPTEPYLAGRFSCAPEPCALRSAVARVWGGEAILPEGATAMHGDHQDPQRSDSPRPGARPAGILRRDLLKLPVALGGAALALPGLAAPPVAAASDTVTLAPRYF